MTFTPPSNWWKAPLAAALLATAIGVAPVESMFARAGLRPGFANLIIVNLIFPFIAVCAAAYFPRVRVAILSALLLVAGFVCGRMAYRQPRPWDWSPTLLLQTFHPILAAATVGYAVLGTLAALIASTVRKVGRPDDHLRCTRCAYLLTNLEAPTCPECGQAFDPARY